MQVCVCACARVCMHARVRVTTVTCINNDCDGIHTVHESHLGQAEVSKLDVTHQCDQQTTVTKQVNNRVKKATVNSSAFKICSPMTNITSCYHNVSDSSLNATEHGLFNHIHQVVPVCTPI